MDEDTLKTNINTLKEMILDEQKLITYVSLSKDLCIHVNDSKKLLRTIVEDIRDNQPDTDLNICYIVSGLMEDNKARTTVTPEKEIDNLRKTFRLIFFEHIYSVSKGLSFVDNVAFLAVNRFEDFPLCSGLIKSNSCIKRSSDEVGKLKSNSQEIVITEMKPTISLSKKIKEESKEVLQNGVQVSKKVTEVLKVKSEPAIKTENTSPKKDSNNKPKPEIKKNGNNNKAQKGIAGFFNKSNSMPAKKVMEATTEVKQEVIIKPEKENIEKTEIKSVSEEMDVDIEVTVKKEPKADKNKITPKEKPKNKTLSIKKNTKVDKKRKRVLHVSDSESDEDKNDPFVDEPVLNDESDDEIPPTPSVNTVKITSGIINPKKRRKIVDKTYTDEEGYLYTKKEEVYESCSDQEEVTEISKDNVPNKPVVQKIEVSPKEKKNGPKTSKKKISPPQKGKQSTLMNFFTKK